MLTALLFAFPAFAGSLQVGAGTTVVVADIGATDVNSGARANLLGEVCQVGASGLSSAGDGWWKGTLSCADSVTYTFSAVSLSVPGTQAQPRSIAPKELARQIGATIVFPSTSAGSAASTVAPIVGAARIAPTGNAAPTEAIRRNLQAGEPVTLLALHPDDAYYSSKEEVLGRQCYPTDTMSQNEPGWHGGPVTCWDGQTYYFYKVALADDPTHEPGVVGGVQAGPDLSDLLGSMGATSADGTTVIEDGRKVKVTEISPDDAFFSDRMRVLGKTCTVTGDLHEQDPGGGWYGGGLTCKRDYFYFYKIRIEVR